MPLTDTALRAAKPQSRTARMFDGAGRLVPAMSALQWAPVLSVRPEAVPGARGRKQIWKMWKGAPRGKDEDEAAPYGAARWERLTAANLSGLKFL